jgi:hypothetical protein
LDDITFSYADLPLRNGERIAIAVGLLRVLAILWRIFMIGARAVLLTSTWLEL